MRIIPLLSIILILLASSFEALGCTSAIISAKLNPTGRPILWKHRDTSNTDNKIEYVAPEKGEYGYVALFNAADRKLKEAWMGMNEVGFAVMNTASYNIKDDKVAESKMDKEGFLMTKALKTCRTVDDFAELLDKYPRPMGVEANFGVIDASGEGAYFETNNHSYKRFNLKDSEKGILVRTNYSHSGRPNEGYGFIREANAENMLQPYVDEEAVTPEVLTEYLSRTFYHDGTKHDYSYDGDKSLKDEDFIPRFKSTATIAIEGCRPLKNSEVADSSFVSQEYIMWTGLGYPPVAEIKAVRCQQDGIDEGLQGDSTTGHSRLADEAKRKRDEVFGAGKPGKIKYIDMTLLYDPDGSGYVQQLRSKNHDTYVRESALRDAKSRKN